MRRKTVGRRKPSRSPIIQNDDDHHHHHNATVSNSDSNGGNLPHSPAPPPDPIPEPNPKSEPVDLLDCIKCANNEGEGALLACTEPGCPVTVHAGCIGTEPNFDDSGNFLCPYCTYKRAVNKTRELRDKVKIARKEMFSFLDKRNEEEPLAEPVREHPVDRYEAIVSDSSEDESLPEPVWEVPVNRNEPIVSDSEEEERKEHDDKGKVSVAGSSVSETKDSDTDSDLVMKDHHAKRKVQKKVDPVKKSLLREKNTGDDVDEEEVTSSRILRSPNRVTKLTLLHAKRKRLRWTAEEENTLKEGVLRFSVENQNVPWRKILEFGCRVFDKTRTPVDLKDKWRNITSKEGCK